MAHCTGPAGSTGLGPLGRVQRGVLYRSGQLTVDQFTEAARRYGIRTVVNLQMPGEELEEERALTKRWESTL